MDAWRLLTHLRHSWHYGEDGALTTTAYFQHIDRSWNRALGVFSAATGSYEQGPAGRRHRQRCQVVASALRPLVHREIEQHPAFTV